MKRITILSVLMLAGIRAWCGINPLMHPPYDSTDAAASLALKANLAGGNTFTGAGVNAFQGITSTSLVVNTTDLVCNAPGYANKCGAGTATPARKFEVSESSAASDAVQSRISNPDTSGYPAGQEFWAGYTGGKVLGQTIFNPNGASGGDFYLKVLGATGVLRRKIGVNGSGYVYLGDNNENTANAFSLFTSSLVLTTGGNVGIGTVSPDGTLHVNGTGIIGSGATRTTFTATAQIVTPKIMLSKEGGYLIKMVNDSGTTVTTGTVVNSTGSGVDYGFEVNPKSGYMPLGMVYGPIAEDPVMGSCASGAECWVCVFGICPVYTTGSCTRGQWMGASDTTDGMAECSAEPNPTNQHDREIGHNIVAVSGGISWAVVHFR